jgi:hypothetical protein
MSMGMEGPAWRRRHCQRHSGEAAQLGADEKHPEGNRDCDDQQDTTSNNPGANRPSRPDTQPLTELL